MKDEGLERWLVQMENTTTSVGIAGKSYSQQIREMMEDENLQLPVGCPSKASLAELTPLNRINKNLLDATHTLEKLREYIWENYG